MKKSNKQIYEGVYRKNRKGFGFVKVNELEDEIYISKENSLNALNQDYVAVKIIKSSKEGEKAEGKIIKIKKHEKNMVVGIFKNNKNFGFVIPDDKSLGTDIFISKKNFGKARDNHKVLVEITKYPQKGKNAEGKIIEILGKVNEAGVDMLSLIKEFNVPAKFPSDVVKEAKLQPLKIEIGNRIDLRDEIIFTIDGDDAKDLDDAVSVKKLDNGHYCLNVHIADVSNYVKQDSKLDEEAVLRGTSIYMLGRVIPMLPRELSNGICSLNENEDRYALSCTMEIDENGDVIDSKVYKSVINVTKRMSYVNVQKILDKSDNDILKKYEKYIYDFELMAELAQILKNKRMKKGYLNLDIPESKIELDIDGWVVDVKKYESYFSNEIIEQFMLIANETIAEKFYWLDAPFIYRVHESPDIDKVNELNKFLFNFNLKIKFSGENIHPKSFADVLDKVKGKPEEKVISNLILRTLKLARYESENSGHFGIASKYYCHFTSPIRRYPDLFIHRVISDYLDNNYNINEDLKSKYQILAQKNAISSSEKEKIATKIEREAEKIKKAEYMEKRVGIIYQGIISSITSFGMFVELENTIEGLVRFEDFGYDEYYVYDEKRKILVGEHTKKIFKVGDIVTVKVKSASKILRQIDFELL